MATQVFRALRLRLRDTRGFMIAEQLISIIFIGLLCVIVAAGLGAAMSTYSRITLQTQADAMLSNAVEVVSDELAYARSGETSEGASLPSATASGDGAAYVSATLNTQVTMLNDSAGILLRPQSGSDVLLVAASPDMKPVASFSLSGDGKTWTLSVLILPAHAEGTRTLAQVQELSVKRIGT